MTDATPTKGHSDRQPTIVWIHGAGLSGSTWPAHFPGLKPDLPGHGAAPCIADPTVERYADALKPGLPERFVLVGHSLGGMVALELAARHGDRVQALILVEAVPTVHLSWAGSMAAWNGMMIMRVLGPKGIAWLSGLAGPKPVRRHMKQQLGQMSGQGVRDALTASMRYDGRPRLSQITAATLVIIGDRNKIMTLGARVFRGGIATADVKTIPGGHMLHIEAGERLLDQVQTFIAPID